MNLEKIADKLNAICLNKGKSTEDCFWSKWTADDLDYNINECRTYCMLNETWDEYAPLERSLCAGCKRTLEKEIRFIYNKSGLEVCIELKNTKEEIAMLKKRLEDLEKLLVKS